MGIDLNKLEKVKPKGSNITARCPACAEAGNDRKGEHLFISDDGHFGCVVYPGDDGEEHRKRIFQLVGVKNHVNKSFQIRKALANDGYRVMQRDILGHLGHVKSNSVQSHICNNHNIQEPESKNTVLSVPAGIAENHKELIFKPEVGEQQSLTTKKEDKIPIKEPALSDKDAEF
jgi:hypothetical protein